jgi:hypothetical protein
LVSTEQGYQTCFFANRFFAALSVKLRKETVDYSRDIPVDIFVCLVGMVNRKIDILTYLIVFIDQYQYLLMLYAKMFFFYITQISKYLKRVYFHAQISTMTRPTLSAITYSLQGEWLHGESDVCLSTQGSWVRILFGGRDRPCFFVSLQYWLVPGSGLESD